MRKNFEINPENGKTIVKLAKVRRTELTDEESGELRIFYWAAYYGRTKTINRMIMQKRWSPFIKSFQN